MSTDARSTRHTAARRALALTGITAAAGAAGLGYCVLEARLPVLRRLMVPVLPTGSRTLRVLHLSDLHLHTRDTDRARWVSRLAALAPDLVVNTGDNISHPDVVPMALDALSGLLERPGVFVFGSNDYYAPSFGNPAAYLWKHTGEKRRADSLPWKHLQQGFLDAGWTDLNNAAAAKTVRGVELDLRGVDDPHIQRDRYDNVAGPTAVGADLRIGIVHAPYTRVLNAMCADNAGIIFAGHTHGGQINLPGFGPIVTNCDLAREHAKGLTRYGPERTWLHVSAGLGTSPYTPVRLACRPEATLLTLVPV